MIKEIKTGKKLSAVNAAFIYTFAAFLIQGVNFISLPIFASLMSPRDFGTYASYENWIAIITVLIGLQLSTSIANAYVDYSESRIKEYVSSIGVVGIISFLLVGSIVFILRGHLTNIFELKFRELFIGLIQCLFLYYLNLVLNEYRIIDKPFQYLVFSCLNIGLTILGGILLIIVWPGEGYEGRILGTSLAACLTGGVAAFFIYKQGSWRVNKEHIRYGLMLSTPLIFHAFAGIVMGKTDQMMLLKMTTAEEMGIYSYGNRIGHVIYVLYTAINQAFVPWYYKKKILEQKESIVNIIRKYVYFFSLVTIVILMVLPESIKLFSPPAYYGSIYTVPLIVVGFYINFLYTFPVNFEFYHKRTGYVACGTIGSAILNVILNAKLIPLLGGLGAAITTVFSYILLLFLHVYIANTVIGNYEINVIYFVVRVGMIVLVALMYFLLLNMTVLRFGIAVAISIFALWQVTKDYRRLKRGETL